MARLWSRLSGMPRPNRDFLNLNLIRSEKVANPFEASKDASLFTVRSEQRLANKPRHELYSRVLLRKIVAFLVLQVKSIHALAEKACHDWIEQVLRDAHIVHSQGSMLYCRLLDLVEDHEVVECRVEDKHQVSFKLECYFLLAAEDCHLGTLAFAV